MYAINPERLDNDNLRGARRWCYGSIVKLMFGLFAAHSLNPPRITCKWLSLPCLRLACRIFRRSRRPVYPVGRVGVIPQLL